MRVLIFSAFDHIPWVGEAAMRYAGMAQQFIAAGHEVAYVTSSFSHLHKKDRHITMPLPGGLHLTLLPTLAYHNNMGLARLRSHRRLAETLAAWLKDLPAEQMPDMVICATPPVDTAYTLATWCRSHTIPFVLDIQDLWPDEFLRALPARPLFRMLAAPVFRRAKKTVKMADAVSAVAQDYIDHYRNETSGRPTNVFYLGADTEAFASVPLHEDNGLKTIAMVGHGQSARYVLMAARAIQNVPGARLLVIGLKERTEALRKEVAAQNLQRIELIEWLDPEVLRELLLHCHAGLIWIHPHSKIAFPNRAFSYFAAGLPVISNIQGGELQQLMARHHLGITVTQNNTPALATAITAALIRFTLKERTEIQQFARESFHREAIIKSAVKWYLELFLK